MKNIRNKIKKLNWSGFVIVFLLCSLGAIINENVSNIQEWLVLMILIGLPISILVLFLGREV